MINKDEIKNNLLKYMQDVPKEEIKKYFIENNKDKSFKVRCSERYKNLLQSMIIDTYNDPVKITNDVKNNCKTSSFKMSFDLSEKDFKLMMNNESSKTLDIMKENLKNTIESFVQSLLEVEPDYKKNNFIDGYNGNNKDIKLAIKKFNRGIEDGNLFVISHNGYIFYYIIEKVRAKEFNMKIDMSQIFEMKNGELVFGENGELLENKNFKKTTDRKLMKSLKDSIMKDYYYEEYTIRFITIVK